MLYTCRDVTGFSLLRLSATAEASARCTTCCGHASFVHPAMRYVDETLLLYFSENSNRSLLASFAGIERYLASHLKDTACKGI